MFIFLGFLADLTFPGVIVHEVAHMLFCKIGGIAVFDACFFRFGNPSGYVFHEKIKNFNTAFFVCVGPLLINTILCLVICFPASIPMEFFGIKHPLSFLLLWLGVSIGMHAFPSNHDAEVLLNYAKIEVRSWNPLAIISYPLVMLIELANFHIIFSFLYGSGIGIGLPSHIISSFFIN